MRPPDQAAGGAAGHLGHVVDRNLVQQHALARQPGDAPGELGGAGEQFAGGLDGEHQADPRRMFGVDQLASQDQELRPGDPDHRHQIGGAGMANAALDQAEAGVVPGDDDVALRDEAERGAEAQSVHRREHRLVRATHGGLKMQNSLVEQVVRKRRLRPRRADAGEIAARAECPARR